MQASAGLLTTVRLGSIADLPSQHGRAAGSGIRSDTTAGTGIDERKLEAAGDNPAAPGASLPWQARAPTRSP